MNKEKRRVPKLRFPEFTEDWEQRKLESILIEYTEKNPGNENLPVLTSSRQGLTKQEDHFGSVQRHDISDYNVIPLGFCTYRNRSDDKTFTFNINRIVPRGLVSKFYPVFEIKNGNADFITEYLNNNTEIIKSLAINAVGTSQVVLSLRTLRNIGITLPLKEEQVAIGDLMRKLDIYITLHQRKLDNLKLKKKALLQKLFPKNGERYPELRFPRFTDAWEQRKADYIFKSVTDKGYPELPVLSASQELGMVYRDQNGIDIQHDKKNETSYKRVLPGQFVIHLRSFQGGFAYSEIEGITSPAYTVISFKHSSEQYGLFWKHVFKSETFIKRLETITYGIRDGRSISFSDFKSLLLQYPSFSEQKLIGDLIAVIERGITLHQRKLDHLQLQKKALLQQMFV